MGPLPETHDGNKYVLVIIDFFSKFAEAFPLPNMEAVTVANKLVNEYIARYGVPLEIHSDQGRQFESGLFSEVCQLLDIKKTRTTPYHPASNGATERMNRVILAMLAIFCNKNDADWDKYLPLVIMAYKASIILFILSVAPLLAG